MLQTMMTFEEIRAILHQRFPLLMVDRVLDLEPGQRITALKNVTGNEIQFLGHFPELAVTPGTLIVEAMGQAASILFAKSTRAEQLPGEFLVLGAITDMRFLVPVVPGDTMEIVVQAVKFAGDLALVEGSVTVAGRVVAKGKLGFARRKWQAGDHP